MSRSTNSNKSVNKNTLRPYTVMCTDIYLLWILIVFPLYYADGYFHLPEKKATFWVTSTLIYVIVCLLGAVVTAFSMKENWSMENFKKNITMTDIFMFGFLISNLIALAMSNNVQESWMATGGRYYGARVLLLVCVVYFLVSRYAWLNQVFIIAFLIGGNGVCLLATFDYFGMDVLGINKQMQPSDWLVFISTMGNANTCASYVSMALAGAICYFCVAKNMKAKVFAGISIVNCSMALITAKSDSVFVGIAIIILIMTIMAISKKIEWLQYIMTLTLMDIGILLLILWRSRPVPKWVWQYFDSGIPLILINQYKLLVLLLVGLLISCGIMIYIRKKNIQVKRKKKFIYFGIMVLIIVFVFMVSKLNLLEILQQGMGIEGQIKEGSRAYIYQKVTESYKQLPIVNKIFGCGQASIRSVLNQFCGEELAIAGLSINSAHNNVLDYLITLGLYGVICYLGVLIVTIKHGFLAFKENKYAIVFTGCVTAYFAQGLFNIEQTNTTTIFWLMLAFCEATYRKSVMKKEDY